MITAVRNEGETPLIPDQAFGTPSGSVCSQAEQTRRSQWGSRARSYAFEHLVLITAAKHSQLHTHTHTHTQHTHTHHTHTHTQRDKYVLIPFQQTEGYVCEFVLSDKTTVLPQFPSSASPECQRGQISLSPWPFFLLLNLSLLWLCLFPICLFSL